MRPTDISTVLFKTASDSAHRAMERNDTPEYMKDLSHAISNMAAGLENLSTGLRATYILLEEVKNLQQKASMPGRRF